MMSGPYEVAQITGFGLHHLGVEPPLMAQVQEPANLRHFSLNALVPAAPPKLEEWTADATATDLTDLPDLLEDPEEEEATSVDALDLQEEPAEMETSPRPDPPAEPSWKWIFHPRTQGDRLDHHPYITIYQDDFLEYMYANFVENKTCLCLQHLGLYPLILVPNQARLCLPHLSPRGWGG